MRQSNQSNERIIKILKKFPTVTDDRPMDEVYRNVNKNIIKKRKKPVYIPVLVGIAALMFFVLMIPTIFQQSSGNLISLQNDKKDSAAESGELRMDIRATDDTADAGYAEKASDESADANNAENFAYSGESSSLRTAVYDEDIAENGITTIGVVSEDAIVVPISLLKNKMESTSRNIADYGFQDMKTLLDSMDLDVGSQIITVTIDSNNRDFFLHNEKHINNMLQYTLRYQDVELVKFVDGKGDKVELGEFGIVPDLSIKKTLKTAHYLYTLSNGNMYIMPADLESDNLSEAIDQMKILPNDFYKSLIPENVSPELIQAKDATATIGFKEQLDLEQGDQHANMRLIEGLLLTAKEFGYSNVKFENIEPQNWEEFHFENPVKVPYSSNRLKQ